ncbi:carbamoyl-phosphate synthase large subunit [Anaplasmataceae bacterium AB001_6]|nr:carbamoyl-phosphate synthase large subunit [Anaplasmataceae bacterium AB001_6]
MKKNPDLKKILVIGSGPIVIGQAGEFDYSGTQACRSLLSEGIEVILLNSNPATIMTDSDTASSIYIEPINENTVLQIIEKEKPQAILPNVGGQTALNLAVLLHEKGILEKYGIKLLCSSYEAIMNAEDRGRFANIVNSLGFKVPKYRIITSEDDIEELLQYIGLPAVIRPSFTLGGLGGGIARTREDFFERIKEGLEISPNNSVQVDESLIGWKEIELELMKDEYDNSVVVCGIENIDPMGVHTGDSITVAPILTLRDHEYQAMRTCAIKLLKAIGMQSGGANVQFAYNINTGDVRIIEINPRVSRSSALASKATGYPIAFVTSKLALGYSLKDIRISNHITAFFEPTIDYVVTKIPRFNFEKFDYSKNASVLSSTMHSVGEVMAIGSNFPESLQKAYQSLENNLSGLEPVIKFTSISQIEKKLKFLSPDRLRYIADAMRYGMDIEDISRITNYDLWFLKNIKLIVDTENYIKDKKGFFDKSDWFFIKKIGFSDERVAKLLNDNYDKIYRIRKTLGVNASYNYIDSCACEFEHYINCFYSTYRGNYKNKQDCELTVLNRKKVIVIGSGPNRIGQGIEFDYVCVQSIRAIKEVGYEAIMINCNPETVSTDPLISDKLYFSPIKIEYIREIFEKESSSGEVLGVIIQFGGQTPLNLAKDIELLGIPILGTQCDAVDRCEDREKFKVLLNKLNLKQPKNFICRNKKEFLQGVKDIGFPFVIRPSYVLGGQSMNIIYTDAMLEEYLSKNAVDSYFGKGGLLLDKFVAQAIEIDIDALSDGESVFIAGISEHIEEAGIHSGDSSCSFPPRTLNKDIIEKIREQVVAIALEVGVIGFLNVQMAIKDDEIYILEVNPRASRTVPFISKTMGIKFSIIATKIMMGYKLSELLDMSIRCENIDWFGVKIPVFSFVKFPKSDVLLGPEMKSTGEVMSIDRDSGIAFLKAYEACGNTLFHSGNVFISVKDDDKAAALSIVEKLCKLGFKIFATKGTSKFLDDNGIQNTAVNKVKQGSPHVVDMILQEQFDLIINTSEGDRSIKDSFSIRSTALFKKCPSITNMQYAKILVDSIYKIKRDDLEAIPIDSFYTI